MSKMSREKGKEGEREIVRLLRQELKDLWDVEEIRRNHQQAEKGGSDLVGVPFFAIEVKRYKVNPGKKGLEDWWKQACGQAIDEEAEPVLIFRPDRGRWRVMLTVCPFNGDAYMPAVLEWDQFVGYLRGRLRV
jgi:hypothetical protein